MLTHILHVNLCQPGIASFFWLNVSTLGEILDEKLQTNHGHNRPVVNKQLSFSSYHVERYSSYSNWPGW